MNKDVSSAKNIHIRGLVQGVGFRPFIYRLAVRHQLTGWVENRNDGVRIHVEGNDGQILSFIKCLPKEAPPASLIREMVAEETVTNHFDRFQIRKSENLSEEITDVSPDIAVCQECLADMKSQPHRLLYPFINCTNCGPRFTIISDLPYDREKTTMEPFIMCDRCRSEYGDLLDRRFHAQPVACNTCGPHYELISGSDHIRNLDEILATTGKLLDEGRILAIKGMGGFHLACDATDDQAVSLLRERKNRDGKPFAVMFRDLGTAEEFVCISPLEKEALCSWRSPVVILQNKTEGNRLAHGVSNGFSTTGVMLPYMPLHYLLFEHTRLPAIVLTSGNISEEPIVTGNDESLDRLGGTADAFLIYNRKIRNRTDDSVVMVVNGSERMIRRSRGYVPSPIVTSLNTDGIFAAGAELVNCFGLGKGRQAIMSQHIGDLKNLETLDFYEESSELFRKLFRVSPSLVACDMHPDYLSSRYAHQMAGKWSVPLMKVQHHHAHIASCMVENELDEAVIGISMDGVGYGTDGNIWGGEFLVCDLAGFERFTHLEYVLQPGGDKATKEPWRMALSYLYHAYGEKAADLFPEFLKEVRPEAKELVFKALRFKINSPLSSSAGRLFDAVSALINLCTVSSFHAEAPMRLEQILDEGEKGSYEFTLDNTIRTSTIIKGIVDDLREKVPAGVISAKFHNTFVSIIREVAGRIRQERGINKVALSGGTFQNRFLLKQAEDLLSSDGFEVYSQRALPSNDGGIALGQLAIAAKRRDLGRLPEIS